MAWSALGAWGLLVAAPEARADEARADEARADDGALPAQWNELLQATNTAYAEVVEDWVGLYAARSEDARYGAVARLRLAAQVREEALRRDRLAGELAEARRRVALASEADAVRQALLQDYDRRVADAAEAVAGGVDALRAALEGHPRAGKARKLLEAWWNTHKFLDWPRLLAEGADPREDPRAALTEVASALGAPQAKAVANLLSLSRLEEEARRARRAYLLRTAERGDEGTDAEVARLEQELAAVEARLTRFQGELGQAQGAALSPEEAALQEATLALRGRYAWLEEALESEAAEPLTLSRAEWCSLYVRGGVTSLLLDPEDDGGVAMSRLRTAVSTYGGPCAEHLDAGLPALAAHWAEALFLESQEPSAWVVFDGAEGAWSIDGTEVESSGAAVTRVRLAAGVHRVAVRWGTEGGDRTSLLEDFLGDGHDGLRVEDGRIAVDVLAAQGGEWVVPVRRVTFEVEEPAPRERERPWLLGAGVTALQFDGRGHVGPTLYAGRALVGGRRAALAAHLAFDALAGPQRYRYGAVETAALLRGRLEVALEAAPARRVRTALLVSPGLIPPVQAVTLDLGARAGLALDGGVTLSAGVGVTSSFWKVGATWLEPVAHLGVQRWL